MPNLQPAMSRQTPSWHLLYEIPLWALKQIVLLLWGAIRMVGNPQVRSFARMALLLAFIVAAFKVGPVLYDRFALGWEAKVLASSSSNKSESQIADAMRRKAYARGFTVVARQPGAIKVTTTRDASGDFCTIAYDFRQPISLFGLYTWKVPVKATVLRSVIQAPPPTTTMESAKEGTDEP